VNPDEWARAREVFGDAVQRRSDERDAYLDEACSGDPALRAEVASLLAAHDGSLDFIERPVFEAAADLLVDDHGAALDGRLIGPYIIRQEIGRGGMGIVYLADDTRLSRRVAVKALLPEVGRDPRRRERLRREARAAAALSHPNIATVYALEEIDDELAWSASTFPVRRSGRSVSRAPFPSPTSSRSHVSWRMGWLPHGQVVHRDSGRERRANRLRA
jgi:hypothetical protein